MPLEITNHDEIIEAIRASGVLHELVEKHADHYVHELELELVVYGRTYGDHQVGPYARLLKYTSDKEIIRQGEWKRNAFYILLGGRLHVYAMNDEGVSTRISELEPKNIFGEMSVLAGKPSSATIVVPHDTEAIVLEIQRPALRLLQKLKSFEKLLDERYREHGLDNVLDYVKKHTGKAFSDELLERLKQHALFLVRPKGHVFIQQGTPIQRLIFIKSGWIYRERHASNSDAASTSTAELVLTEQTEKIGEEVGWDFLGPGNWLGLEAIENGEQTCWNYSATVMTRSELLQIELQTLRSDRALLRMMREYFPRFSAADDQPPQIPPDRALMNATAKEVNTGIVDASNLLVMDMDLCVRCGNCSMACHKIHGRSRLMRHGIHIARPIKANSRFTQHVLLPSVCLHCQDPECLTGCPTGAIGRYEVGQIDIDKETCIGCGDCAAQCPYDAISMVPVKEPETKPPSLGRKLRSLLSLGVPDLPPPVTETANLLAIKCNLCQDTPLNPKGTRKKPAYSCEENCPTGALVRVNPLEYFSEAKNSIGIVFRDSTHAIGRNIHKRDVPALIIHALAIIGIISITWFVLWNARRYTLDAHFVGTWVTMRWFTGLLGLGSIAVVITYPIRKQFYKKRLGPLRYWKLVHAYLGLLAGIVLLIHGGRDSGGLLTSMLMVSFDVAIVSGLFGISCYFIVPRIMTSIEGDPLLIEDLRARREELRQTLGLIDARSDERLRKLVKEKMRKRFFSFRYLMRQYARREDLKTILASARAEFDQDGEALGDQKARDSLVEAVNTTVTLRRVDSLIYLHQLLKLWLAPHVVSVSIMLALLCVHIVQVILFTVR